MTDTQTFELEITGELSLEFDGSSLLSESSHWVNGRDRNRYHTIDIYEPSDGGYILYICFVTHWQGEHDQKDAWELDTLDDVARKLDSYDPTEFLVGFPIGQHFIEKQLKLEESIKRDWVELKGKVLNSLGIKRIRGKGQPQHPLGACRNPGWSIPEQIRERIQAIADQDGRKPSDLVVAVLRDYLKI
jgi:hypothetical protein